MATEHPDASLAALSAAAFPFVKKSSPFLWA